MTDTGPEQPRWRWWEPWVVLLAASALTACLTWPLPAHLFDFTRLSDRTLDDGIYYWNCWWIRRALFDLHTSPLFCPDIFLPNGASVAASPLCTPVALVALPFQAVLGSYHGAVVAVKLCLFGSFPLLVLGMTCLLRRFGIGTWVAFLAGCALAFTPFRTIHLGRVHYLGGWITPFYMLALWNCFRWGGRWRLLLVGCWFALGGAWDASLLPEFLFAGLFLWLAHGLRHGVWSQPLVRALGGGLAGAVFLSPLILPFLLQLRDNEGTDVAQRLEFHGSPQRHQLILSPDLNNLSWYTSPGLHETILPVRKADQPRTWTERLLPASWVPEWNALADATRSNRGNLWSFRPPGRAPFVEALGGLLVLVLCLWWFGAGLARNRWLWPLAALAVLGLLLALGPYRSLGEGSVRMPYYWLGRVIPGMKAGRYPAAHLRLLHLGVCLVAAFGLQRAARQGLALAAAALAVVVLAWLTRPCQMEPIFIEPVHQMLAESSLKGGVLEFPFEGETPRRLMALGHIVHGRPTVNGPITRVPAEALSFRNEEPLLNRWGNPPRLGHDPGRQQAEAAENMEILRRYGVRFVIVRRHLAKQRPEEFERLAAYLALHAGLDLRRLPRGHLLGVVEDP